MTEYEIIPFMQIVLYQSTSRSGRGILLLPSPKKPKGRSLGKFLSSFGYGLIVGSLALIFIAAGPVVIQEIAYRLLTKTTPVAEETNKPGFADLLAQVEAEKRKLVEAEAESYGVSTDFSLVIPKIKAASKVIPNVDPANEEDYKTYLIEGVGHAAGTKFPGENGTIYLFSHSTNSLANISRFNAVFYSLKDMVPGDEIIVFYAGKKFTYKATEQIVTKADELKWLTEETIEERLILQTCWPPGTSFKRLLIVAKPV